MRVLICPQEFKGSLTAIEATTYLAAGVIAACPEVELVEQPLADGGPGTLAIVLGAVPGTLTEATSRGPLGAPVHAAYGLLSPSADGHPRGLVEAAATAGLGLLPPAGRDPGATSTFGVGEQLWAAILRGASEVIVGVGGTSTNDGGAGAAQALQYALLDEHGIALAPGGLELLRLDRIDVAAVNPRLQATKVRVAVDVRNSLLGPEGATAIYGPQKGVMPELALILERALENWARVVKRDLGVDIAAIEGGGAGGGLAAGLVAATGATIESGAVLIGAIVGLPALISKADLVITGEGRLDAQTAYGKTVAYVAELSAAAGKPCLAVAGSIEGRPAHIADVEPAAIASEPIEASIARAPELVRAAAERLMRRYSATCG